MTTFPSYPSTETMLGNTNVWVNNTPNYFNPFLFTWPYSYEGGQTGVVQNSHDTNDAHTQEKRTPHIRQGHMECTWEQSEQLGVVEAGYNYSINRVSDPGSHGRYDWLV